MLDQQRVETVRQLLDADISQREIHRLTGVSRDTIRRIFKGKWEAAEQRAPRPRRKRGIGRCADCGARVRLPCVACRVRRHQVRRAC